MQREALLAKEAKYEHGLRKSDDYDDVLTSMRDNNNASRNERAMGNKS